MLKLRCWEPPSHYLCTPEPDRPGCIISIQKGMKTVNTTSTEKRLVRKPSFLLYKPHCCSFNICYSIHEFTMYKTFI